MKRKTIGFINGTIAAASYGTNPLFALPLYARGLNVNSVLFYRYAIAVLIYALWLKFVKKMSFKITKKELLPIFALGVLYSISSITLFSSFQFIEAGVACTILFIYPVIVALIMSIFFKEKLTKTVIGSIFLTSIGILLLYKGKNGISLNINGIILVLFSALSYALYMIGINTIKPIQKINRAKLTFYVMTAGLTVYIYNILTTTPLQTLSTPSMWVFAIGLALFPTIISLETITISIKLIGSTTTAILGALEPLTAIFFGKIFFHEQMTVRISSGVILILIGVFQIILNKEK